MRRVFETAVSLSGIVLFLLEVAYMDKILYESKWGRPRWAKAAQNQSPVIAAQCMLITNVSHLSPTCSYVIHTKAVMISQDQGGCSF